MSKDHARLVEDDMLNDALSHLISSLRDDISRVRTDVRDELKEVKADVRDMSENLNDITRQLGGPDGVRERLTTLEVQMRQVVTNSVVARDSVSPSPDSAPRSKKRSIVKDHTPALIAGGGSAGLLYTLIEIANQFLKTK